LTGNKFRIRQDAFTLSCDAFYIRIDAANMITSTQLRAARALLAIDQRRLAKLAGLSLPTIQRMEASDGVIRGNVDSLTKLVAALEIAGIELIGDGASSTDGGRGVRLKSARSANIGPRRPRVSFLSSR
jgi:transcriptional regulator with XRE-family HTH domain